MTNSVLKVKKYHKWKIGQLNIQTCSDDIKLDFALQECVRANLDVICFQEVRRLLTDEVLHRGYRFYWKGLQRLCMYGVGIAIKDCAYITTENVMNISERLLAADISVKGCKLRIISAYAPTLESARSTKQSFYRELTKLCQTEKNRKVLLEGDFNAEMQISRRHSCFEGSKTFFQEGTNQSNENAELFLLFCHNNKLCLLNTWYDHPIHHRITWHHPNGYTKKVIDYSLSQSWLRQFITDVRVRNSYFNSDHRLVVTYLRTPANKAARTFKRSKNITRPDLDRLHDQEIHQNTRNEIESFLLNNQLPTELDDMHTHLVQALQSGRNKIPRINKEKQVIPWSQNGELTRLHRDRLIIRKLPSTPTTKAKLRVLNKSFKERIKIIRNKMYKDKGKELNEAKEQRKMTKLWKQGKSHDKIIKKKPRPLNCPGLKDYFESHFNPDHSSLQTPAEVNIPPDYIQVLQDSNLEIINTPPTDEEISCAMKQLNNGKSSLDIEAEIVKLAESIPSFTSAVRSYFAKIWDNVQIPSQWRTSKINSIWKGKGSLTDPSKQRGISNSSILCKIGMNIVLKRHSEFYNRQLKRTQFGFRKGCGANDAIYLLRNLQDIASISQRKLYTCFIDLTAAFDHVNRDLLFKTIRNRLASRANTNIDLVESLYRSTTSYLHNQDPATDSFKTGSGVRQGSNEGPPLYNLYSDYSLRVYDKRVEDEQIPGLHIPYCIPDEATNRAQKEKASSNGIYDDAEGGYADDLGIFSWSQEDLCNRILIINQVFKEFGLNINKTKTETVVFNWPVAELDHYPESFLSIDGSPVKNSTSFKYLGVYFSYNNVKIGQEEMNNRINSAQNAFVQTRKMLTNKNIELQTRIMFLNALVRSRLTYGCHAWRPSGPELQKLDATYRYFLRHMIFRGHARVNPPPRAGTQAASSEDSEDDSEYDWRFLITNADLHSITKTTTVSDYYHQQQFNWISHLIRRDNDNVGKILTFHNVVRTKRGRKSLSILERVIQHSGLSRSEFLRVSFRKENPQN